MKITLTREERERIVRTSDADRCWVISTASPKFIRKFTKLGYPTDASYVKVEGYVSFLVPPNVVSFRRLRNGT
jgi:hypothetical protein